MAQTQNTYPIRVVSIEDRTYFTHVKLKKPQYIPYIPTIQATMNKYIVPYAYLAMGYVAGGVDMTTIQQYTQLAQPKISEVLNFFGASFTIEPVLIYDQDQQARMGLKLRMAAQKGTNAVGYDADIVGSGPDFGPLYEESKDLAIKRWEAYTKLLTESDVRSILGLAALGYELFMTEGSPTPKQQLAVVKHRLKLSSVDPNRYIDRVREVVDKYGSGYEMGVMKYSYINKWITEGLKAATKATQIVLEVL
jgi:hypothetical protein